MIWDLARGAGIAGFLMLSLATSAGAITARHSANLERRVVMQYVHRASAFAGIILLILHVGMILADSYARVGWVGALVPFAAAYRPAAVALGVLGMYLLVAVAVTGMLRVRFASSARGAQIWRRIHLAAYAAWASAAWHFLSVGTDSGRWWGRAALLAGMAIVGTGVAVRLLDRRPRTGRPIVSPHSMGAVR
jgi:predicted ferric reductase